MPKKTMYIEQEKAAPQIAAPRGQEKVIHIPGSKPKARSSFTIPLLIFTIASVLFLLAYAGPDIGTVLAYLVIPMLSLFPGLLVWERFGRVAGILAGLLIVSILTPAYGSQLIDNSILLFTSLQAISRGVLILLSGACLGAGLLLLGLRRRK